MMQEDFFVKYLPLTLLQGFEKVVWGFTVRGSRRPNRNCNILIPKLWPSALCLSRSPGLLNLESTLLGAGFPYYISSISVSNSTRLSSFCSIRRPYITFKLPRDDMDMPPRLRNFFRYLAIGMYLWNGLCDRHRAEIAVMQFRDHSLPVRQSMRV